jgi:hypothetical protein
MRLAISFILCFSACAPTRTITKPLVCARIRYSPHRPDAYFLGNHSVTREAYEDELSQFPDAKRTVRRTHAMFAAGATLAVVGATVFFFGMIPALASRNDHAFEGVAGTAAPTVVTGISLLGGSHVEMGRAAARYNAQIGDHCPRAFDEEFP